jgi:hypothetical protein
MDRHSAFDVVISAIMCGTSSSGSARMSMTASAVEGMTFGPMPRCSIVGTSVVRSIA